MAAANNKDTIYIDIDDEITSIIDKVGSSPERIVALVLPKRATVFQSVVNMKLLKRSSEQSKKHVVLITSETALLPLAGSVGLHVAKNLQSKPTIPLSLNAHVGDELQESISLEDDTEVDFDAATAAAQPVGELATQQVASLDSPNAIETIELDDDEPVADAGDVPAVAGAAAKVPKKKKDPRLKVPNFERFRLLLILGGIALVALIVCLYYCLTVLPKAKIVIKTNAVSINSSLQLTLDTATKTIDQTGKKVPARLATTEKTFSQQVPATGQKNNGQKATATSTITNCSSKAITISAGTGISAGNLTYITQRTISLDSGNFDARGNCKTSGTHVDKVDITASKQGAAYNIAAGTTLTVASGDGYVSSDVKAQTATAATGGTDDIVKVISQADIDSATQKISAQNTDTIKSDLQQKLSQDGLYAIAATLTTATPKITPSSQVGDQAETVTVSEVISYSMFGVDKDDLSGFIKADVERQIDTKKQEITDDGLSKATIKVGTFSATAADITVQTSAKAGPDLKAAELKQQIKGLKAGQVQTLIKSTPGVTEVKADTSPFWVSKVPGKDSKITIIIDNVQQ